jgi:hypothetical protein
VSKISVSKQLAGTTRLWRYLSLDKLIDLLSTQELFFTPIAKLIKQDPYEGYLPSVAMEADAQIFRAIFDVFESTTSNASGVLTEDASTKVKSRIGKLKGTPALVYPYVMQRITVNCWHANDGESEAMWRLYADNGKAVAIETTVDAFIRSIKSRRSAHHVQIYPVKYLDFFDKTLKPTDCVVEGHRAPLLKRLSYQHENEVRAFINPQLSSGAAPVRLPVDATVLVNRVHVSPYPSAPFASSVKRVCELFGLSAASIVQSKMLSGAEELLKPFSA